MKKLVLLFLVLCQFSFFTLAQVIENFDDIRLSWTESPEVGVWEIGKPSSGPMADYDNQNLLATNLSGPYLTDQTVTISSSLVAVPEITDADGSVYLEIMHWFDIYFLSNIYIIIENETGETETSLKSYNDYNRNEKRWIYESLDVTDFAGQNVSITFKLAPYSSYSNTVSPGWYIDHIKFRKSDQPQSQPLAFEDAPNVGVPKDSSYHSAIKLIANPDAVIPELTINSSNTDIIPVDSVELTTEDNLNYQLTIRPVKGESGFSEISIATKSGESVTHRSFMTYVYEPYTVFEEDFEDANELEWQKEPATAVLWNIGEVHTGPKSGYNSERAMGTNLFVGYNMKKRMNASIISRPIELPVLEMGTYSLMFDQWRDLISCCGDEVVVYIRTGSGEREVIYRNDYRNGTKWESLNLSLEKFEGETIRLEFMLYIYGAAYRDDMKPGWIIDNVKIQACAEVPVAPVVKPFIHPISDQYIWGDSAKVAVFVVDEHPENLSVTFNSYNTDVLADEDIKVYYEYPKWVVNFSNIKTGEAIIEVIADNGENYYAENFKIVNSKSMVNDSLVLRSFYDNMMSGTAYLNWGEAAFDEWAGVDLNDEGRVVALSLSSTNIVGKLPKEFGKLDSLRILNLSSNNGLESKIPEEIYSLSKLEIIDLSNTAVFGHISPQIAQLKTLKTLNLSGTKLYGGVPPEIGLLESLEILDMSACEEMLIDLPVEFYNLRNLESADFTGTTLNKALPAGVGKLEKLKMLLMGGTNLPALPDDIGDLKNLVELSFSNNGINSLPAAIGGLDSLKVLDLSSNNIKTLPDELGLLKGLQSLNLYQNRELDSIPVILGAIDSLEVLNLSSCLMEGNVPAELAQLENLRILYLNGNRLSGPLPDAFGSMQSLQQLNVSGSSITALPALGGQNKDQFTLYASYCTLHFDDMERNRNLKNRYFNDQKVLALKQFYVCELGTDTVLHAGVRGKFNRYQWYKDDILLEGDTLAEINLSSLADSMAGDYHCIVTNDSVPNVTLNSGVKSVLIKTPDNAPPVFSAQTKQLEYSAFEYTSALEATDPDGDELTFEVLTPDYGQEYTVNGTRIYLRFNSSVPKSGADLIVAAYDGKGGVDTAIVSIRFLHEEERTVQYCYPTFEIKENTPPGTSLGFIPALELDTAGLYYYISSRKDLIKLDSTTGEMTLIAEVDYEKIQSYSCNIMAGNDKDDLGYWYTTFRVIDDETEIFNLPPFAENQTFSVAENEKNDAEIGTVLARDGNGDELAFYLTEPSSVFSLDMKTGVLTLADSSAIDFETTKSYSLQVAVSDLRGGVQKFEIIVTIEDVNELVVADTELSVDEFATNGTKLGKIDATHLENIPLQFEIIADAQTVPFRLSTIDPSILLVSNSKLLDRTVTDAYVFKVAIASSKGEKDTVTVTAKIKELVEVITANDQRFEIEEFTPKDSAVFTVQAAEAHGNALSFHIIGDSASVPFVFADSLSGVLSVSDSAQLDKALQDSIVFDVAVKTVRGTADTLSLTVLIKELPEQIIAENQYFSVYEFTANGLSVGTLVASEKRGSVLSFAIVEDEPLPIKLKDSLSGEFIVSDSAAISFDRQSVYLFDVALWTEAGTKDTIAIELIVLPVPQNIIAEDQNFVIPEFSPLNSEVGQLQAFEEHGAELSYSVFDKTEEFPFALTAGAITVIDSANLNYELHTRFEFGVELKTSRGHKDTIRVSVDLLPRDHMITAADQEFELNEFSPVGAVAGVMLATEKYNAPIQYSLLYDTLDLPFVFSETVAGQIEVADSAALSYDKVQSFTFDVLLETRLSVTDTVKATIKLLPVPQVIVADGQEFEINERSEIGSAVGQILASEQKGAELFYTMIADSVENPFVFDTEQAGLLKVGTDVLFDERQMYAFAVEIASLRGTKDTIAIRVKVNPLPQHIISDDIELTIPSGTPAGTKITSIEAYEQTGARLSYTLIGSQPVPFGLGGASLSDIVVVDSAATDTADVFIFTVEASTQRGTKDTINITVFIKEDVEVIVAEDQEFSFNELSPNGTLIGFVEAYELKGADISLAIVPDTLATPFELYASGGELLVSDSASINYDVQNVYVFNLEAKTEKGFADTFQISISVLPLEQEVIADDQKFIVEETDSIDLFVGRIPAYEKNDAEVFFSILETEQPVPFSVEYESGDVYMKDSSLFDSVPDTYSFHVLASTLRGTSTQLSVEVAVRKKDTPAVDSIKVFPAVATDFVNIVILDGADSAEIAIYDALSDLVSAGKYEADTIEIKLAGYSNGSYTIVAKTVKGEYRAEFIVSHNGTKLVACDTSFVIYRHSPTGTVVGSIDAYATTGADLLFTIIDEQALPFAFVSSGPQLIVADSAMLTDTSAYEFTVEIKTADDVKDTITVGVELIEKTVEQIIASDTAFVVNEFSAHGALVGEIKAFEASGKALYFSVIERDSLLPFAFADSTAKLVITDSAAINSDSVKDFVFAAKLETLSGMTDTVFVTVKVSAVEQVIIAYDQAFLVEADAADRNQVGTVAAYETHGAPLLYSVIGDLANIPFSVDESTGDLFVKNEGIFDSLTSKTYSFNLLLETERGAKKSIGLLVAVKARDTSEQKTVEVSPSVAKETVTVVVLDSSESVRVKIENADKEVVLQSSFTSDTIHIEVSSYEPGLYTVMVETDSGTTEHLVLFETSPQKIIAEDLVFTIGRNIAENTFVGTIDAYEKYGASLRYSIIGDTIAVPFWLDAQTGEVFAKGGLLTKVEYSFTVLLETEAGTKDVVDITVKVKDAVAVDELDAYAVKLYPTVPVDFVYLECTGLKGKADAFIFTMQGLLVMHVQLDSPKTQIDISCLPAGKYFLRTSNQAQTVTKQFVK